MFEPLHEDVLQRTGYSGKNLVIEAYDLITDLERIKGKRFSDAQQLNILLEHWRQVQNKKEAKLLLAAITAMRGKEEI